MEKYRELKELLARAIRPRTLPLAVHLLAEEPGGLPEGTVFPRDFLGHAVNFCQGFGMVRTYGWKVAFRFQDNACPFYLFFMGLREMPELVARGEMCHPYFTETPELGALAEESLAKIPAGTVKMTFLEPLGGDMMAEPGVILIYGDAAQMTRLIAAANYRKGSGIQGGPFTARGSCSSSVAGPFVSRECRVGIPGGGERVSGHAQDHELVFSVPRERVDDLVFGLKATEKSGVGRYPTHFKGYQMEPTFPEKYSQLARSFGMTTVARRE